jgi:hypothetical protein
VTGEDDKAIFSIPSDTGGYIFSKEYYKILKRKAKCLFCRILSKEPVPGRNGLIAKDMKVTPFSHASM